MTPREPKLLPPHVRPRRLGGRGKLPVFELLTHDLGEALAYRPDDDRPDRHGFIEPRNSVPLDAYQLALAATQPAWKEVS